MTTGDYNVKAKFCSYHKEEHPVYEFSGKNRYCRVGLNEYRRKARVKQAEKRAAFVAEGAPLCPLCKKNPILRKNAKRCKPCIKANRYMCKCGRVTHNPNCGKCRWKKNREAKAAALDLVRRRGLNVVTGSAECVKCGARLQRDPAGNIILKHKCKL